MPFPSVTFCNMNPIKESALEAAGLVSKDGAKKRKKRALSKGPLALFVT